MRAGILRACRQAVWIVTSRSTMTRRTPIMPPRDFRRTVRCAIPPFPGWVLSSITAQHNFRSTARIRHCCARTATAAGSTRACRPIAIHVTRRTPTIRSIRRISQPGSHRTARSAIRHPDGAVPDTRPIPVSRFTAAAIVLMYGRFAAIVIRIPVITRFSPALTVTGGRKQIHVTEK